MCYPNSPAAFEKPELRRRFTQEVKIGFVICMRNKCLRAYKTQLLAGYNHMFHAFPAIFLVLLAIIFGCIQHLKHFELSIEVRNLPPKTDIVLAKYLLHIPRAPKPPGNEFSGATHGSTAISPSSRGLTPKT